MKKIILIIILSQFSFLLWAANNDNGESKYTAKFYSLHLKQKTMVPTWQKSKWIKMIIK